MGAVELQEALVDLYAADPSAFVARRETIVSDLRLAGREELARQVKALRKPSLAAWAVNLLARTRADDLARVHQLGSDLRSAQSLLTGNLIRSLSAERHRVVDGLTALASDAAAQHGHSLSAGARQEVADTFTAALVSPEAADAVTSGLLTRALAYAGLGDVDLADAMVATPAAEATRGPRRPVPEDAGGYAVTEAPDQAVASAREELARYEAAVALAEERLEHAQRRAATLAARAREVLEELAEIREGQSSAGADLATASDEVQSARAQVRHAQAVVRRASRPG